jgi:hypothetical protein
MNTFEVLRLVKAEVFSDLFLIKVKATKELRLLRRIKKILFNSKLGGG